MFGLFRRKKKNVESIGTAKDDINLKSGDDPPMYFRKAREEVKLTEIVGNLLQRLKNLDNERTELVGQIYQLGEEAEREAEQMQKELSTLKTQVTEFEKVLNDIHTHRKGVHS